MHARNWGVAWYRRHPFRAIFTYIERGSDRAIAIESDIGREREREIERERERDRGRERGRERESARE